MLLDRLPAPALGTVCKLCIAVAALSPAAFANAQTATPGASAASAAAMTPAERAKRDGDQVFHWILIHSDKPRKPAAAKDEKPAVAVARVKAAARPAHADEPAVETSAAPASSASSAVAVAVAVPEAKPATTPDPVADPAPAQVASAAPTAAASAAAAVVEEDAVEPLTPVSQTEPRFPVNLVRTLRTGQVQVKFTVLPDGSVAEPAVIRTSNPRLNASALAAIGQWRFAPLHKPQHGVVDLGFNDAE